MRQRRCEVRECGATVLVAEVDGKAVALNPTLIDVAVPDEHGALHMVRGYQPHAVTCVDISARLSHRP